MSTNGPELHDPLPVTLEAHFRRELLQNCGLFFQAIAPVVALLNEKTGSSEQFWRGIVDAMMRAGNVSKILWPIPKKSAARGALLRASIGISDSSVLKSRRVRDGFEHFDERLETWHQNSKFFNIATTLIGPPNSVDLPDIALARWYDNSSNTLHVFDDSVDFQELTREMAELQKALVRQHQEHPGDIRYG